MKNFITLLIVPAFLFYSFQKESGLALNRETAVEYAAGRSQRIIYLFFKADKDTSGNERISLQETQILEGKLKLEPAFDRSEVQNGDLIITVMAPDGKEAGRQLIKDPLNPELEVYEKEGMSRHRTSLHNVEFSVRFAYSENITSVKIEKATESGAQVLFTQKL